MVCAVTHLVHEEGIGNDRRGGETLQCRKARFAALDPDSYGQVLEDRLSQVTDDLGVRGSQLPRELVCAGFHTPPCGLVDATPEAVRSTGKVTTALWTPK